MTLCCCVEFEAISEYQTERKVPFTGPNNTTSVMVTVFSTFLRPENDDCDNLPSFGAAFFTAMAKKKCNFYKLPSEQALRVVGERHVIIAAVQR